MSEYIAKNAFLTEAEMTINARYIYNYMTARGWSPTAVCGMLGNMETESTINPAIWQNLDEGNTAGGYGLVQWTPASKFIEWCVANRLSTDEMDSALKRIEWELENGEQYYPTDVYPLTFAEFKTSTETPYYLAMAFLANYERPADPSQPARGEQARKWYNLLKGSEESELPARKNKPMPLWLLLAASRRR